jgi:[ribosomal protein S18]-alanine N-acetyltransferase
VPATRRKGRSGPPRKPSSSSSSPRIRRATQEDHDALRALEDSAFQPWRRASRGSLRRSLGSPHQSVWMIDHPTRKGQAAALLILWHHQTRLRVYDIATHPDLRGQGLGFRLMQHAEGLARQAGCADVSLEADAKDASLIAWYEAQGYGIAGRMPRFYVGGRPAVRLRKAMGTA